MTPRDGSVSILWMKRPRSVQDATGHEFATRLSNVYTIGKGTKPWVSILKGKGIKLTIEEARKRQVATQAAA
ncbi:hypothetical protein QYF36_007701 [Acer negundo]|nr:hypothetical protein QYF36_007701 [Acer negundo]